MSCDDCTCCGGCGTPIGLCGCNTCGNSCTTSTEEVDSTRGGCTPVLRNTDDAYVHDCAQVSGSTPVIGNPQYEVAIVNAPDDILRNQDGSPVLVNGEVQRA